MSLTLGRQGGVAQPLRKRTVGQINIAHVYDGTNHMLLVKLVLLMMVRLQLVK
jgi:hypothetical protein